MDGNIIMKGTYRYRKIFITHGIPEALINDNETSYEFIEFMKENGITHQIIITILFYIILLQIIEATNLKYFPKKQLKITSVARKRETKISISNRKCVVKALKKQREKQVKTYDTRCRYLNVNIILLWFEMLNDNSQ